MTRYSHYSRLACLFDFPGPGYMGVVENERCSGPSESGLRTAPQNPYGFRGPVRPPAAVEPAQPVFSTTPYIARGSDLLVFLRENYPSAAVELQYFLDNFPKKTVDQQELYTRTFDVQAITTLDIGYVLFGDDYKRAELLSNLTREHKLAGNDCGSELADHLPNVLRLMPLLSDPELLKELVGEILVPALKLMIREFDPERSDTRNTNYQKHYKTLIASVPGSEPTIYCRALKALLDVLVKDFPAATMSADRSGQLHSANSASLLRGLAEPVPCRKSADFLGSVTREMEIEDCI